MVMKSIIDNTQVGAGDAYRMTSSTYKLFELIAAIADLIFMLVMVLLLINFMISACNYLDITYSQGGSLSEDSLSFNIGSSGSKLKCYLTMIYSFTFTSLLLHVFIYYKEYQQYK